MIYFNQKKVIMAVIAKQQEQQLTGDSIPAIRIFSWARTQLEKVDELYKKRKSEIIKEVADRLESKGFPCEKISSEIVKQLSEYVDDKYVREVLPNKYKSSIHSHNARVGTENRAKQAVKQMLVEEYKIEKLHTYSKEYLIEIVKYLDNIVQVSCHQADEKMHRELE